VIVRVPGIGIQSAKKICAARKFSALTAENLQKIGVAFNRAKYFIHTDTMFEKKDWLPGQIKSFILSEGISKYSPNFSPQIKLF
jgi:predicted DNA-binding helix-hairpin-helix protein